MEWEEVLEEYAGLVVRMAGAYKQRHKVIDYDDILQEGYIALWDAYRTYDSNLSKFKTHAITVIKWRMVQYVCKQYKTRCSRLMDIEVDYRDDGFDLIEEFLDELNINKITKLVLLNGYSIRYASKCQCITYKEGLKIYKNDTTRLRGVLGAIENIRYDKKRAVQHRTL